ncbi:putative quinol monooxygenase [Paenibacillus abyssi]|uniref:Antibiotic biosynthesis monooxygenase n=1 Tax=Paenibacillus abyssi TaxID=1340531 RepID=A0A917FMS6_9BACL|nr:putative quinol monooxygenase [Paenibacillus abyssi]GGF93139.1 antibiotic biosynthesis monooxygenase [Paenibacillus abyssi]
MIVVTAIIKIKEEKRNEFLAGVQDLITSSQEEKGCISYRMYEDTEIRNAFLFLEEWESQEILDLHHQEPHFKAFSETLDDFLAAAPEVKVHEVSGTTVS